jgi:hypothetical protein
MNQHQKLGLSHIQKKLLKGGLGQCVFDFNQLKDPRVIDCQVQDIFGCEIVGIIMLGDDLKKQRH